MQVSKRWWGLVLDMVGLKVTEEGRMLCRSRAWRACRCCNAPGSQMSWCGSDLRLSLGIEPPVAIWRKGGHVAEHRDRRILWQRTRERFTNEMAATKADGRREQQRGAVDQGTVTRWGKNPDERRRRSTSQNTSRSARKHESTSRHSEALACEILD